MDITAGDSQGCDAPVGATLLPSLDEQRQADEVDGGGDGQWADEAQHQTDQSSQTQDHLQQGRHQDGPLDLGTEKAEGTILNVFFYFKVFLWEKKTGNVRQTGKIWCNSRVTGRRSGEGSQWRFPENSLVIYFWDFFFDMTLFIFIYFDMTLLML